ncbi:MAG TPA: stage II sporulation protein P [Clostridia bacterium]|nr:stage II sporulation protein P [Clostridia bacterium]
MSRAYKGATKRNGKKRRLIWTAIVLIWAVNIGFTVMLLSMVKPKAAEAATSETEAVTTAEPIKPEIVARTSQKNAATLYGDAPKVLIYHTHITEAYTKTERYSYIESDEWRTNDMSMNVAAVGEALAQCLNDVYGIEVIHDMTNHEQPKLSTAYERSELTMLSYKERYPSLVLTIDLHRDAYEVTDKPTSDFVYAYGQELARVMFVVGRGDKYEVKPFYMQNLELAELCCSYLVRIDERLVRPVRMKAGRYNQHITNRSLLIEVGHNANTFEQALAVVPYLAEAIVLAMDAMEEQSISPSLWVP